MVTLSWSSIDNFSHFIFEPKTHENHCRTWTSQGGSKNSGATADKLVHVIKKKKKIFIFNIRHRCSDESESLIMKSLCCLKTKLEAVTNKQTNRLFWKMLVSQSTISQISLLLLPSSGGGGQGCAKSSNRTPVLITLLQTITFHFQIIYRATTLHFAVLQCTQHDVKSSLSRSSDFLAPPAGCKWDFLNLQCTKRQQINKVRVIIESGAESIKNTSEVHAY